MKKSFKEILTDVFEPFTIIALIVTFLSGLIVFTLLVGDTFLIALRDSFVITFAMATFIVFGAYIKHLEKN